MHFGALSPAEDTANQLQYRDWLIDYPSRGLSGIFRRFFAEIPRVWLETSAGGGEVEVWTFQSPPKSLCDCGYKNLRKNLHHNFASYSTRKQDETDWRVVVIYLMLLQCSSADMSRTRGRI